MKFLCVESRKPTRDERSWIIGMAEAGFNIYYVAFHFDIFKTIAYRIINRFVQTKLAGKKTNSTGGTFHSNHFKIVDIYYSKPALYNI